MTFQEFEKIIINMLIETNEERLLKIDINAIQKLKEQSESAQILTEIFTGVGFQTDLYVPKKIQYRFNEDFVLDGVYGIFNGIEYAVGFILFVREGYLCLVEGSTISIRDWPESFNDISLYAYP